ncbi:unnamed protein product, partial [Amoebophrya sp. A120]|eukprot:GSA120T00025496001.1
MMGAADGVMRQERRWSAVMMSGGWMVHEGGVTDYPRTSWTCRQRDVSRRKGRVPCIHRRMSTALWLHLQDCHCVPSLQRVRVAGPRKPPRGYLRRHNATAWRSVKVVRRLICNLSGARFDIAFREKCCSKVHNVKQ